MGSTHTWISSAGRYRSVDDHTLDDFGLENKSKARVSTWFIPYYCQTAGCFGLLPEMWVSFISDS